MNATHSSINVELSLNNQSTLDELVRVIGFTDSLTLLFVKCNVPTLRYTIANKAKKLLLEQEIEVVEIDLPEEFISLRPYLRKRLVDVSKDDSRKVVFLYGLERFIPSDEPNAPMLAQLNLGRELFHRDAPHPLVFWLPDYAITAIARGAPDFWAWRSGVFDFETESMHREEALQSYVGRNTNSIAFANLTVEQKRNRQKILQNLLSEYQSIKQDNRTISEQAEILFTLGLLSELLGEVEQSREYFQQSLKLCRKLRDEYHIATNLYQLGLLAALQGKYSDARQFYKQSLRLFKKLENTRGVGATLNSLGGIALTRGQYDEGKRYLQQALDIFKRMDSQVDIATGLHNLGVVAKAKGIYDEAHKYFEQSLDLRKKLDDTSGVGETLRHLGDLARIQHNYEEALVYYEEAQGIFERIGSNSSLADILQGLGGIAQDQGDYEAAQRYYEQSQKIAEMYGYLPMLTTILINLGITAKNLGDYDSARQYYERSLQISEKLEDRIGKARTLGGLGAIAQLTGQYIQAYELFQQSLDILEPLSIPDTKVAEANFINLKEWMDKHDMLSNKKAPVQSTRTRL